MVHVIKQKNGLNKQSDTLFLSEAYFPLININSKLTLPILSPPILLPFPFHYPFLLITFFLCPLRHSYHSRDNVNINFLTTMRNEGKDS